MKVTFIKVLLCSSIIAGSSASCSKEEQAPTSNPSSIGTSIPSNMLKGKVSQEIEEQLFSNLILTGNKDVDDAAQEVETKLNVVFTGAGVHSFEDLSARTSEFSVKLINSQLPFQEEQQLLLQAGTVLSNLALENGGDRATLAVDLVIEAENSALGTAIMTVVTELRPDRPGKPPVICSFDNNTNYYFGQAAPMVQNFYNTCLSATYTGAAQQVSLTTYDITNYINEYQNNSFFYTNPSNQYWKNQGYYWYNGSPTTTPPIGMKGIGWNDALNRLATYFNNNTPPPDGTNGDYYISRLIANDYKGNANVSHHQPTRMVVKVKSSQLINAPL